MASKPPIPITALDAQTESINMLVYGDPGAGKTHLAGTIGERGLIIAVEPGTVSAARSGSKAKVAHPKTAKEFYELLTWLRNGAAADFEWIAIDTITELHALIWTGILSDAAGGKENDNARIQDYGTIQSRFKRVVRALNDLPCNVLYLAHAMNDEDEEGEPTILPDIPGKNGTNDQTTMSRWVCGTVHLYGYLKVTSRQVEGEEGAKPKTRTTRRVICKRSGPYFGKDRYNIFGSAIVNPNMAAITAKINAPVGAE